MLRAQMWLLWHVRRRGGRIRKVLRLLLGRSEHLWLWRRHGVILSLHLHLGLCLDSAVRVKRRLLVHLLTLLVRHR